MITRPPGKTGETPGAAASQPTPTTPGALLNGLPRPRIALINIPQDVIEFVRETAANLAPTVTVVNSRTVVDLAEYDCVVTMYPYVELHTTDPAPFSEVEEPEYRWTQDFPPHLSILFMPSENTEGFGDFMPPAGEGANPPPVALMLETHVPGRHVKYADGLPDDVSALVRRHMAPAAMKMAEHTVIDERSTIGHVGDEPAFDIRCLLYGPGDRMLALSYRRNQDASAWIIPSKIVGDLSACLTAALREWHELYPDRFPALPDWRSASEWASGRETLVQNRIDAVEEQFDRARARFDGDMAALTQELEEARDSADMFERALLSATGDELEHVVAKALVEIGFDVQLMDEQWPVHARREDLRIADPADPGWRAIAEVKGFTKGVAESGLLGLQRHLALYVADEKVLPSRQWYIANHWLREDPAARPRPLAGREEVVDVFASADGLIVNTRALFVVLRACQGHPDWQAPMRQVLRQARGMFGWDDALIAVDAISESQ